MKIDSLKTPSVSPSGRPTAKAAPKSDGVSVSSATTDVRLSSASTALAAQEPSVNFAKVQEIRQAISEGRFEINASAIADRLIATARELVGTRSQA